MSTGRAIVSSQDKMNDLKAMFEKAKPSLLQVLPKHVTPERMLKVALTSVQRTPSLLACKPLSLLRAIFQAGELGLEAGGLLGEGYLIPFKDEVQFIPGYRGLIKLARQSGQIASIEARCVYEHDEFEIEYGMHPKLFHKPNLHIESEKNQRVMFVYAVATFREGSKQVDVMSRAEVDAIRARSKSGSDGPWVTDYPEMAKKTVVRRLCKMLPLSVELARAIEHEDAVHEGVSVVGDVQFFNVDDLPSELPAPAATQQTRTEALKSELASKAAGELPVS